MTTLTCPRCGREATTPDDAPPGMVYACPNCKGRLPPVPGGRRKRPVPEEEGGGPPGRVSVWWQAVGVLALLLALLHGALWLGSGGVPEQVAWSALFTSLTVTLYVVARAIEKSS